MIVAVSQIVIACSAPHGGGGLGQHFAEVVEAARAGGQLSRYYSTMPRAEDAAAGVGVVVSTWPYALLEGYTPARFNPGWRNFFGCECFDRNVASRLSGSIAAYTAFGGQALHGFRRAQALGATELTLVAANSHVDNVFERHAMAIARYPLEPSWLNPTQVRKTRREYDMADVILVASDYSRESFLARGAPASKLRRIEYKIDPRFCPNPTAKPNDGVFRVVCVGSVWVTKGVPVLIEAFQKLARPNAELTFVGGWGTRGMRRYLEAAMAGDPRIKVSPGDPLPHLHRADVCVQPTYEDGFAYAPMEAMACGVPVIVTQDTGMKEHVREGETGHIVPTGSVEAITQCLEMMAARK